MYVEEKDIVYVGFSTIHGFRHPPGALEQILHGYRGTTVWHILGGKKKAGNSNSLWEGHRFNRKRFQSSDYEYVHRIKESVI